MSLTSVHVPDSVTTVGYRPFYNCTSLSSINVPLHWSSTTQAVSYEGTTRGAYVEGCSALTAITVPEGMTVLPAYAFNTCKYLTQITLPDSLVTIGTDAMRNCTGLTAITVPNQVLNINPAAFTGCQNLSDGIFVVCHGCLKSELVHADLFVSDDGTVDTDLLNETFAKQCFVGHVEDLILKG